MRKSNRLGAVLTACVALAGSGAAGAGPYGFADAVGVHHDGRTDDAGLALGLRLGVGLPILESATTRSALELAASANRIHHNSGTDDSQLGAMLDLVHTFKRADQLSPFVFAGVGGVKEECDSEREAA